MRTYPLPSRQASRSISFPLAINTSSLSSSGTGGTVDPIRIKYARQSGRLLFVRENTHGTIETADFFSTNLESG